MNLLILQAERHDAQKNKRHEELRNELHWLEQLTPIELAHVGKTPHMQYLMRELSRTKPVNEQRP